MNTDAQTQFANLIYTLGQSPGIEGFQGITVNADGSMLVIERWACRYFSSIRELVSWAAAQQTAAQPKTPQPQISHATSNAS